MYISKLKVKNFKCFQDVEFEFNSNFNLIIGENNSGKSTIFEALRLWQLAFNKFLKDRTNNKQSSFRNTQYYTFTLDEITFLRVADFKKLFFSNSTKSIEISLTISNGLQSLELPVVFTRTTEGQVLRFELCKTTEKRKEASDLLAQLASKPKGSDFKEVFLFTYINPVFNLSSNEPKYAKGFIISQIHEAKASNIIRNILLRITPDKKLLRDPILNPKMEILQNSLKEIIFNNKEDFLSFSKQLEDEDKYIQIFAKNSQNLVEVELNQLGSGTLNIINILAILAFGDYENFNLNALLLDEPDSHLHADHQKRLYQFLNKISNDENKQIFVITHNHELIESANEVLYIDNKNVKRGEIIKAINKENYNLVYKDLSKDYYEQQISLCEKREIEEELKRIKKPTLYCEGSTDVTVLKEAFNKLYDCENFFNNEVDILDANGAPNITNLIKFSQLENKLLIGLYDSDREGLHQIKNLKKNLAGDLKLDILKEHFHYQIIEGSEKHNTHAMYLPIPEFRLEEADFFKNATTIEYMFSNETLKDKLNINMVKKKGNSFEQIATNEENKMLSSEKAKVVDNIKNLSYEDFIYFKPLFETIAEIVGFELPNNGKEFE